MFILRKTILIVFNLIFVFFVLTSCKQSQFDDEFLPGYANNKETTSSSVSWNFDNSSDYICEGGSCSSGKNIVVNGGGANLQTVDTEHSGSDFNGTLVGATLSSNKLTIDSTSALDTSLSSSWTPHYSDLIGYWKMDGDWQDSIGINHLTANDNATFSTASKVGSYAGQFDGSNDNAFKTSATGLDFSSSDELTAMTWLNYTTSGYDMWFTLEESGSIKIRLGFDSSGNIFWNLNNGTNRIYNAGAISNTGWRHVAYSASPSGSNMLIKLYLDGKHIHTYTDGAFNELNFSADEVRIGSGTSSTDHPFNGRLDDVAVWSKSLSGSDIATIYNRQKQKYAASYQSSVIDMGTAQSVTSFAATTELPFAKELTTSVESSSHYSSLNVASDLSNGLVGYWPLNEANANTAPDLGSGNTDFEDKSINSNHGNEAGGLTFGTDGVIDHALTFDGVDDEISIANDYDLTSLSLSAWFMANSTSGQTVIANIFGGTNCNWGIDANSGNVDINEDISLGGVSVYPQSIEIGTWYHVVAQLKSDSELILYLNGKKVGSGTYATGAKSWASCDGGFYIGSRGNSSRYFNGAIDEVAIWSRAISESEVQELYRRGANRVKYQLRTCSDSTCSTDPEWIGPGGDGTTYFSELYNRVNTDIDTIFSGCYTSNPDICDNTEFSLSGNTLQDPLNILFSNFPAFDEAPLASRYFQYRVLMEAEDNTACSGSVCLPSVSGVSFTPTGYYYGGSPEIKSTTGLAILGIPNSVVETKSGGCTIKYQFSNDGTNFKYWNGSTWTAASSTTETNTISDISTRLSGLTSYPATLYFKAFMESDGTQDCSLDELKVNYDL